MGWIRFADEVVKPGKLAVNCWNIIRWCDDFATEPEYTFLRNAKSVSLAWKGQVSRNVSVWVKSNVLFPCSYTLWALKKCGGNGKDETACKRFSALALLLFAAWVSKFGWQAAILSFIRFNQFDYSLPWESCSCFLFWSSLLHQIRLNCLYVNCPQVPSATTRTTLMDKC